MSLDPVRLLQALWLAQQTLSNIAAHGVIAEVVTQLRTLQRRVKAWRAERAKEVVLDRLRVPDAMPVEV